MPEIEVQGSLGECTFYIPTRRNALRRENGERRCGGGSGYVPHGIGVGREPTSDASHAWFRTGTRTRSWTSAVDPPTSSPGFVSWVVPILSPSQRFGFGSQPYHTKEGTDHVLRLFDPSTSLSLRKRVGNSGERDRQRTIRTGRGGMVVFPWLPWKPHPLFFISPLGVPAALPSPSLRPFEPIESRSNRSVFSFSSSGSKRDETDRSDGEDAKTETDRWDPFQAPRGRGRAYEPRP